MRKLIPSVQLFSLALLGTSCATIVNGSLQSIEISSNPTGAEIWVDHQLVGKSPTIVEMKRKDNHFVQIRLEGYQPYELTIKRDVSGWVAGNLAFGGFIGLAVDAITGGIYTLKPDQVSAEMIQSNDTLCHKTSENSFIAVVMTPDPSWQKVGHLTTRS